MHFLHIKLVFQYKMQQPNLWW